MTTKKSILRQTMEMAYSDLARGGTSDKVYNVQLEPLPGNTFTVNFQFGRRGSTLQTGTKTPEPVAYDKARAIFLNLIDEKTSKGYSRLNGESHSGPVNPTGPARTAWPVELLTEITANEAGEYVGSPSYLLQEKVDGHRRQIHKTPEGITSYNKKGEAVPLPAPVARDIAKIPFDTVLLDGELIGDRFIAFDLLERGHQRAGETMEHTPYGLRFAMLLELVWGYTHLFVVRTSRATEIADRMAWIGQLHKERAEGVVFKLAEAPYRAGRSDQHKKLKFVKTCSAVVAHVGKDGKDSIGVGLYEGNQLVYVGSCSMIGKKPVKAGAVIEVRYLYASAGKKLVQAVYLGERDDVDQNECAMSQLQFKQGEAPEERA